MIQRIFSALAVLLFFTVGAHAQDVKWPDELVRELVDASKALQSAENLQARQDAYWKAEATMRAFENTAPGLEFTRRVMNIQMSSEAAIADLKKAASQLESAVGPDLSPQAAALVAAAAALEPHAKPPPSAVYKLMDAIETYDKAAAANGVPTVRQAIAGLSGREEVKAINAVLDKFQEVKGLYDTATAAAKGDREAVKELADELFGKMTGVADALAVPKQLVDELIDWNEDMYQASTEGLNIVTDAMKTGRVDTERLNKVTQKLKDLRRGPWGSHTARKFLKSWCSKLPVLSGLCEEVFEEIVSLVAGCDAINCDCDSIGGGIIAGPLKVQCKLDEQNLRDQCRSSGKARGTCNPGASGPAAYPK